MIKVDKADWAGILIDGKYCNKTLNTSFDTPVEAKGVRSRPRRIQSFSITIGFTSERFGCQDRYRSIVEI
jgi:hypothetical protein